MNKETKQQVIDRMTRELQMIHEYVESLHNGFNDVEQNVRNARSALESNTTLQLENMVHDHYYHAGENHVINEIREILGLKRLYMPGEKERIDAQIKASNMGSREWYDCPPLPKEEYTHIDGDVKAILLGEECDTIIVFCNLFTTALRMTEAIMKEYDMDENLPDASKDMKKGKVVWRKADQEDGDFAHMFSWSEYSTKNNPNAVDAIIVSLT